MANAPRQPQDHKAKSAKSLEELEEYFSFHDHDGQLHVMPNKTLDVITTKFVRVNRRRDEVDYVFTAIEALAGGDEPGAKVYIDAVDSLDRAELKQLIADFGKHVGASLGE